MKAKHIVAAAFVALGSLAVTANSHTVFPRHDSLVASRSNLSRSALSEAFGMMIPGGKEGWYPEKIVTQTYDFEGSGWNTAAATAVAYDDAHRVASVNVSMPAAGELPVYMIALGYGSEKAVLPDTVTVAAFSNPSVQYYVTYDEKVATYPVKIEKRTMLADGDWSDWSVRLEVDVKRDDKGRVTSVVPKTMKMEDLPIDYEKIEVTYGDDYPVAITSYVAEPRDNGRVDFDDMVKLTNMTFDQCDNQILLLTDLYKDSNRLTACDMTDDDGTALQMTFTYGENGSYTALATGIDDGESVSRKMEMTYTDAYGSYTMTTTTQYTSTGYFDEEYERVVYNEFGLVEESEKYEQSTDPDDDPLEDDSFIKGITDYDEETGLPCEYQQTVKVEGTETFVPVMRMLFDGYEPTTGIVSPVATPAPAAAKGIFTIEGRRVPEGTTLAPGVYIIDGVKTLVH